MNSELLHGFYLGDLLIEPHKGQITSHAGSRHLPPKAAEVLLCLAQTPGELVTRRHLLETVWGVGRGSSKALGVRSRRCLVNAAERIVRSRPATIARCQLHRGQCAFFLKKSFALSCS